MNAPQIEFVPLRDAVSTEALTTLDVLIKIIPPQPEANLKRPELNLGLVIDRSGSMAGKKIAYARQAACYAVQQLLGSDRVSVTIYDDIVETLIPSTLATEKAYITRQIERIQPRNMTALHDGWVEGGRQVSQYLNPEGLNRVILLSDGLANKGQTNADAIASDVYGLAQRGVSTTTMGVGDDYNEDLLEVMANSGDGNYYYIDTPEQLPEIFQTELQGLMATMGREVRLGIEPQADVDVVDVFNDLDVSPQGEFKLPNLVKGNPFVVVVRLKVPPMRETDSANLCNFRLSWDEPEQQERQRIRQMFQLPVVAAAALAECPLNPEVQQQVVLMSAARAKKEAVQKVDEGDYATASQLLQTAREQVLAAPASPLMEQEAIALMDLDRDLQSRRVQQFRKMSTYQSHRSRRSMSQSTYHDYQVQRSQRYRGQNLPDDLRGRIEVIQGDITKQQVDAIVNATDNYLSGSAGVDAAIHRAAGSGLKKECEQIHRCETGEAKITRGYNLPARWVIHTAGPAWQGGHQGEDRMLALCYQNCLTLAEQYSIKTIAFPAISTGFLGFPSDWASRIACSQVRTFLRGHAAIEKVVFVCFQQRDFDCYLNSV
jgi:Ca-activated chloride channel family protein